LSNAKACAQRGGQMVLFATQPMVNEVLTTSGVATLIPIVADEQAAIEAVAHIESD
jgi:anti-anti-sigma regulatory factor